MGMLAKVKQVVEAARIITRNAESLTRTMSAGMDGLEEVFYKSMARFNGRQVAIVGPKGAGKTTLLKVFREPNVPGASLRSYAETELEPVEAFQSRWTVPVAPGREISYLFKFRQGHDLGGENIYREQYWLREIMAADVIFYVVEWDGLLGGDKAYMAKMEEDFRWFGRHVNVMRPNSRIVVLFNKVDKYCPSNEQYDAFVDSHGQRAREILDRIRLQLPRSYRMKLGGFVFTSLTDELIRNECFVRIMEAVMGEKLWMLMSGEEQARRESEKEVSSAKEERAAALRYREGASYHPGGV